MTGFSGKRGSALMQVLVLGGVIASIVILLLRFSVNRTVNVARTARTIEARAYAEGCMAHFTTLAALREMHGLPPKFDGITPFATAAATAIYSCNLDSLATESVTTMSFTPVNALEYKDNNNNGIPIPTTLMKVEFDITREILE
jgi:hypothetical protein